MELLIVTLAYTLPGRDADVLVRIRLISDAVRNAPGLVSSRFYRSRGNESYYLMLTTWEDEESWHNAHERHNPKQLLLTHAAEVLTMPPQQWLMSYLWGYYHPIAAPVVAAVHLATIRAQQADFAQQGCLKGLRLQTLQPSLAFAFLSRGIHEEHTQQADGSTPEIVPEIIQGGSVFLNLFSWINEEERENFYADPHYRSINTFLGNLGTLHVLPLEPL